MPTNFLAAMTRGSPSAVWDQLRFVDCHGLPFFHLDFRYGTKTLGIGRSQLFIAVADHDESDIPGWCRMLATNDLGIYAGMTGH